MSDHNGGTSMFGRDSQRSVEFQGPKVEASSEEMAHMMNVLELISFQLGTNLKFTKAIYRGTKKSLTGPGNEPSRLHSNDMGTGLSMPLGVLKKNSTDAYRMASFEPINVRMPPAQQQDAGRQCSPLSEDAEEMQSEGENQRQSLGTKASSDRRVNFLPRLSFTNMGISTVADQHKDFQNRLTIKLWRFMEDGYMHVRYFLVMATFFIACLEYLENFTLVSSKGMTYVQLGIESGFALELLVRLITCHDRVAFVLDGHNMIDFMSSLPMGLRIYILNVVDDSRAIHSLLALTPSIRLLKALRHIYKLQLLKAAFISIAEALPMLLFTLFLITSTGAGLVFYVEPRSTIPSLSMAMYHAIVTMGSYGDFTPSTEAGRIWACCLCIIGPIYLAIPVGIIGNAFSEVWQDRHRLLTLHYMRRCVKNAGYSPKELRVMFSQIDKNKDGTLDFEEFVAWLDVMDIKVPENILWQVFESFDEDNEGTIDFSELLRGLFPHTHSKLHQMASRVSQYIFHSTESTPPISPPMRHQSPAKPHGSQPMEDKSKAIAA